MTKDQFIWLVIRFSGFFWLVKSYAIIFKIPFLFVAILQYLPVSGYDASAFFTVLIMAHGLAINLLTGIVILYLLFGGRLIFKVIDRAASVCSEGALQKDEYVLILIRFVGVWWVYQMACVILRQANTLVGTVVLKSYGDPSLLTEEQLSKYEELFGMLDQMGKAVLLVRMIDMVVFALLAWYFLKKGGLIIRWFRRRWLGSEDVDLVGDIS